MSKIQFIITRSLSYSITHDSLHTTAFFAFGDDPKNKGLDRSRAASKTSILLADIHFFFDPALVSLVSNSLVSVSAHP